MPERRLHWPAAAIADGEDPVLVTPGWAGWSYAGLRVIALGRGQARSLGTGTTEMAVLPLSGSCLVECQGQRFELEGRRSVFERVTDFAYVPMGAEVTITATAGGEFALPAARAARRLDPAYGPAEEVPVEVRGAGHCTRQITNFMAPGAFPADKLVAVEVLTPEGNWSSYPPHKHDEPNPECGEAVLEEIYYFRISGRTLPLEGEEAPGFAVHKTYAADGEFDVTVTVRDGDVFLIPRGYHGPSMAAPGYHLYYLNVLAGPAEERTMAFCDDPKYGWIRQSWDEMQPDPRLPMTSAKGELP
ncbi:MAG: 5-deoxy-glucuronate isomerase [Actinomycetota bacterium]|nr:5-deoxy-glucuronate isomerase [Actinomycetota bacterium]